MDNYKMNIRNHFDNLDDKSKTYDLLDSDLQNELEEMQSPISRRKEISPELDELEEEFFEAFQEYRET